MPLTIQTAAENWLAHLQNRKRRPAKPASLRTFGCYVNRWIVPHLGHLEVAEVGNAGMRDFVARLAGESLAPKTVCEIANTVKQIIASVVDPNGDQLYPRAWNAEFIDVPEVRNQNQPIVSAEQIEAAIAASSESDATLYALAAGSGARFGELLALRIGSGGTSSCWNPADATLTIRTSLWNGVEQLPKTASALRTIELAEPLNDWLRRFVKQRETGFLFGNGRPLRESTARSHLDAVLPGKGFHAFRRYRTTTLRADGCREDVVRYWLGHSSGSGSITDRYSKLGLDAKVRRAEADRCGLGFSLSAPKANREMRLISSSAETEVVTA